MGRLLQVREFDTITDNKNYEGRQGFCYLSKIDFKLLKKVIYENENEEIFSFVKILYRKNIGEVITIRNYVGVIQIRDGFSIEILPKIHLANGKDLDYEQTKKVFLKMLCSMEEISGKVFNEANLKVDEFNLYEIFIHIYLREVKALMKKRLKSSYVTKEQNLNYYKGRLLVSKQVKKNFAHTEKFYVKFDEFELNCPENRLIQSTLKKLLNFTMKQDYIREIKKLLLKLNGVKPSTDYKKDFLMISLDRNTKDYQKVLEWSKIFLTNKSFSVFSGDITSRAILFPMERVYECYVSKQIKKRFSKAGWEVRLQKSEQYLFVNPAPRFALKPDIILRKEDITIIMDTKWKRVINKKSGYDIAKSDLYQMYAYSKKYDSPHVFLLYPISEKSRGSIQFDSGDGTSIHIYFIELSQIEKSLKELQNMIE